MKKTIFKMVMLPIMITVMMLACVVTLSACGETQSTYYTVTFDSNGGSDVESQEIEYGKKAIEPIFPTKNGYDFDGWYLGSEKWSFSGYTLTSDITLTANWEVTNYDITYVLNGGTNDDSNPSSYTIEDSAIIFAEPTRTGYTFTGWSVDEIEAGSIGNVTTTASWGVMSYDITYVLNGGTNSKSNPSSYTIEDGEIKLADASRDGYYFMGWYEDESFETAFDCSMISVGGATIYAKWEYITNGTQFLEYELGSSGTAYTVVGIGEAMDTDIIIPSLYNGLPVTEIGSAAFRADDSLTSVVISDSVEAVGRYAFYDCSSLTSVIFGDSVEEIGNYAFYNCSMITEIVIPDSVETIGYDAFYSCSSLTSVVLGSGVKDFGSYAFKNCALEGVYYTGSVADWCDISFSNSSATPMYYTENFYMLNESGDYSLLTELVIPDSVEAIGDYAFAHCDSLTSVVIGSGVESISSWAFYYCTAITSVYYNGNVADWCGINFSNYSANPTYYASNFYICDENGDYSLLTELVIPDSVEAIGNYAFNRCTLLTSVIIGSGVETVGNYAFSGCSNLTSVVIGDSVETIGVSAFHGCSLLTNLVIPASVEAIGNYAFNGCDLLVRVINYSSLTITAGSYDNGNVGYYAKVVYTGSADKFTTDENGFVTCTDGDEVILVAYVGTATDIVIPDNITAISDYAFEGCISLTSVVIGSGVETIGDYAFAGCSNLTSVVIGSGVETIGACAFAGCSNLTRVVIGESVTSIGWDAFYGCSSLIDVYNAGSVADWCGIDFERSSSNPMFYASNFYMYDENGDYSLLTELVIPDSVEAIGNYAFYRCTSLTSVVIGSGVETIGVCAFAGCSNLTRVVIGDSVEAISFYAFEGCTSLTSVTFEDTSTWYRTTSSTDWANKSGGTEITVTSTSTAAYYLRSMYYYYYWYKV